LWAAEQQQREGNWFDGWAAAPTNVHVHGIELMQSDVERARIALAKIANRATFECANICDAKFSMCDAVVILDVLHYIDFAQQEAVLKRIFSALTPHGKLLLRVGDAAGGLPFHISAIGSITSSRLCAATACHACIAAAWPIGKWCWKKSALR
jgi:SAM-dependent methyltransferase